MAGRCGGRCDGGFGAVVFVNPLLLRAIIQRLESGFDARGQSR